ncbi:MAG: response regulator transcription factor [Ignavibacteria bacterium]|nr:response regulator transcription factor [Ignavibacteria bacterium]MBT8381045.1 response regulator transcription factor [Ignavibacteria bacterium]MBT8393048.1 response regulator transcription factor [Ignavibacteria bacterium]NNJ52005.1 response regulator transcription factor [Ignavibacteriaceae bacterium]NNL19732.1 response regulator transcription factor [Ignavibacteriaceae bacterium]
MIKILIVDDHAIVREGLKQIVGEENDMLVSGEAEDTAELFKLVSNDHFDIAIIDISMPGRSGLDALKDLKKNKPDLPVLILSMFSEEQYGLRAIKAGAAGYMKKVSAPNELVSAIRNIVNGGKYINQSLAEKLAEEYGGKAGLQLHEKLSDREYQIMCLIASGKNAEQISNDLSISVHTFYTYRNRIFEKMQLKSNVELTQYVIQKKLIEI